MEYNKERVTKKMILLRDGNVFNGFIKAEAISTGKNESAIVEEIVINHYLNQTIPEFNHIVIKGLTDSENVILYVTREILKYCLENPDRMTNSMREMVKFICSMEILYPTDVLNNEISSSIIKELGQIKEVFQALNKNSLFFPCGKNGIIIGKSSIEEISNLQNLLNQKYDISSSASRFVPVLYTIDKFWNTGSNDKNIPTIRNLKCIYSFLLDLCNSAHWADTYNNRNILFGLIKNLRLTENLVEKVEIDKVTKNKKPTCRDDNTSNPAD